MSSVLDKQVMVNSTTGSFSIYFPPHVTVSYNPKEINTFYINCFCIVY
jgi:hypothetical protein